MLLNRSRLRTLAQKVRSLFSRLSPNGHMYIGGAGGVVTNGFQPGNYVESTGSTYASTDGPCGLVLDAPGSVGSDVGASATLSALRSTLSASTAPSTATCDSAGNFGFNNPNIAPANKTHRIAVAWSGNSAGRNLKVDLGNQSVTVGTGASGSFTCHLKSGTTGDFYFYGVSGAVNDTLRIESLSCKEITGIHASQATAGYKPIERRGIVNLLLNSNAPATQTVSLSVGTYTLSLIGTGSIVITGMGSGTLTGTGASDHVTLTLSVAVAGSVVFTKAGSVTQFGLYLGTLTASQIQQYGGIPLTTTVPASSSLGPQYLAFDGVDDSLGSTFAAGTLPANADVFMVVRRDRTNATILAYQSFGASRYLAIVGSGSALQCIAGAGSAWSVFVDGVQIGATNNVTGGQVSGAIPVGEMCILEMRNLDLSAWTGFAYGCWNYDSALKGAIAHVSITPALTDSERTLMRTQAAKAANGRLVNGAFVSDF